jgi:hypothetical protein
MNPLREHIGHFYGGGFSRLKDTCFGQNCRYRVRGKGE